MKTSEIEKLLRATHEDGRLSRREVKTLRALSETLEERERAWARDRAFKIGQEALATEDPMAVLAWVEEVQKALLPPVPAEAAPSQAYFSPGLACLGAIQDRLRAAQRSVDICVFTITDDRISDLIIDTGKRGVSVRIISDNDKATDLGSDVFQLQNEEGIEVRMDRTEHHMHHKYAVFDSAILLTGSYNWTRSAAQYNAENLLVTQDRRLLTSFGAAFEELWRDLA